ncbi:hypothetical protein BKA66DRAFT_564991 [Pyrenochaeta sp. MPI-SDFR-AT-0127]|nr:hypothetical protein BKA66DRAFT_564991 [Pyrenochaeta sp. MPI-SDFR-AT-0127]
MPYMITTPTSTFSSAFPDFDRAFAPEPTSEQQPPIDRPQKCNTSNECYFPPVGSLQMRLEICAARLGYEGEIAGESEARDEFLSIASQAGSCEVEKAFQGSKRLALGPIPMKRSNKVIAGSKLEISVERERERKWKRQQLRGEAEYSHAIAALMQARLQVLGIGRVPKAAERGTAGETDSGRQSAVRTTGG